MRRNSNSLETPRLTRMPGRWRLANFNRGEQIQCVAHNWERRRRKVSDRSRPYSCSRNRLRTPSEPSSGVLHCTGPRHTSHKRGQRERLHQPFTFGKVAKKREVARIRLGIGVRERREIGHVARKLWIRHARLQGVRRDSRPGSQGPGRALEQRGGNSRGRLKCPQWLSPSVSKLALDNRPDRKSSPRVSYCHELVAIFP